MLFSNSASSYGRKNQSIKISSDEGKTWPIQKTIFKGKSAYSCLADSFESPKAALTQNEVFSQLAKYFPNYVESVNKTQSSRLAWCYGDLGIALSLCRAKGHQNKQMALP